MTGRLALFASGSGSTAEAIIRAYAQGTLSLEPRLVVCNKPEAFVIQRIKQLNQELGLRIVTALVNHHTHPDTTSIPVIAGRQTVTEQSTIIKLLRDHGIDLVVLAGYMKRVGPLLIDAYGWRAGFGSPYQASMINTHPGLLPATAGTFGIHTQAHVITNGHTQAGQSLHLVSADIDTGPVVAEHRIAVRHNETPEELFARVQHVEKLHIADDIQAFWHAKNTLHVKQEAA